MACNNINKAVTANPLLEEDLKQIIEKMDFHPFFHKTLLITGATGLIGSRMALLMLYVNQLCDGDIHLLLQIRNKEKAQLIYGDILNDKNIELLMHDITQPIHYNGDVDYIIHCASITESKKMIQIPVDVIKSSLLGTMNILDFACTKEIESMVYVSSMEMYGAFIDGRSVSEEDQGYLNPLNIRSNYPESKRMCENMCVSYFSQYNVPVKIARLAQTFGAGVFSFDNRVFSQFAKSVIAEKDIVLHTKGESEGNYCYLSDALYALLILLVKGKNGDAYNVVNESSHTTIKKMAEMVANEIAQGKIKVLIEEDTNNKHGYAADTKMKLSSKKLQELGWEPTYDLKNSYIRLIESLRKDAKQEEEKS